MADADRIYLELDNESTGTLRNLRWLFLKVLGRDQDAAELASQLSPFLTRVSAGKQNDKGIKLDTN